MQSRGIDPAVAVSFAAEDEKIADEIVERLREIGITAYHYKQSPDVTLGSDLVKTLDRVFSKAPIVVVIHSRHYHTEYTAVELEAALSGAAATDGLVVVRADNYDLPEFLQSRTFWPLNQGTRSLVTSIAKKLGRRPVGPFALLGICMLITAALTIFFISWLGFSRPTRSPDAILWFAATIPFGWYLLAEVTPRIIGLVHRQRSAGSLRGRVERVLDVGRPVLMAIAILSTISFVAFGWKEHQIIVDRFEETQALIRDTSAKRVELWSELTNISTLALKSAQTFPPQQIDLSIEYANEFERKVSTIQTICEEVSTRITKENSPATGRNAEEIVVLLDKLSTLTLDSWLGHQVRRLAEVKGAHLSEQVYAANRKAISDTMLSYNQLLTQQMLELDTAWSALELDLANRVSDLQSNWVGVIPLNEIHRPQGVQIPKLD